MTWWRLETILRKSAAITKALLYEACLPLPIKACTQNYPPGQGQGTCSFPADLRPLFEAGLLLHCVYYGAVWASEILPQTEERCRLHVSGHRQGIHKEPDEKQISGLVSQGVIQLLSRARWISIRFFHPWLPRLLEILYLTFGNTGRNVPKYFLKIETNFLIRAGKRVNIDICI